jgi:hypothetical protein
MGQVICTGHRTCESGIIANPKRILSNERKASTKPEAAHRAVIISTLATLPGIHLAALRRETNLGNGVLRHHLRQLVHSGEVRSLRDGNKVRFFLASAWKGHSEASGDPAGTLLEIVLRLPGVSHSELSDSLGMKGTAVDYHVARLVDSGAITVRKVGRERRYWSASPSIPPGASGFSGSIEIRPERATLVAPPISEIRNDSIWPNPQEKPDARGGGRKGAATSKRAGRPEPPTTQR